MMYFGKTYFANSNEYVDKIKAIEIDVPEEILNDKQIGGQNNLSKFWRTTFEW